MNILTVSAFALTVCACAVVLSEWNKTVSMLAAAFGAAAITLYAIIHFSPFISQIGSLADIGDTGNYFGILVKAAGICAAAGIASDICKDSGQASLAGRVDAAGRLCLVAVSLPLFSQLLSYAANIING